jgi:hypothetical protein
LQQLFLTRFPVFNAEGQGAGHDISPREFGEGKDLAPDVLFSTLTGPALVPFLDPDDPTFVPLTPEVIGPNLLGFLPRDYPLVLELEAGPLLARGHEPPFGAITGMIHDHDFAAALRVTAKDWQRLHEHEEEAPFAGWDYLVISAEDAMEGLGPGHFPGLAGELLVRGVATPADYKYLRREGFSLFEGPFFAEPEDLAVRALRPDRAGAVRALSAALRGVDVDRLVGMLEDYPDLVLRLLGLLNSAAFKRAKQISSVQRAVVLLGYRELTRWLSLLLFMRDTDDYQPTLLFREAYLRGALTQRTLQRAQVPEETARSGYLAGILLVLQALLRQPAHLMAEDLDLAQDIRDALRDRSGPMGEALTVVEQLRGSEQLESDPVVNGVRISVAALYGDESEVTREAIHEF